MGAALEAVGVWHLPGQGVLAWTAAWPEGLWEAPADAEQHVLCGREFVWAVSRWFSSTQLALHASHTMLIATHFLLLVPFRFSHSLKIVLPCRWLLNSLSGSLSIHLSLKWFQNVGKQKQGRCSDQLWLGNLYPTFEPFSLCTKSILLLLKRSSVSVSWMTFKTCNTMVRVITAEL